MFDAGVSWKCAQDRLNSLSLSSDGLRGVFISHDHSDHASAAGVFHRKSGAPLFMSTLTLRAAKPALGKLKPASVEHFVSGQIIDIGHVSVEAIPTPHDAADPSCFIVDDGFSRVGILTDLGHGFPLLERTLADLDAVFMESNYDEEMLRWGGYPENLKKRIRGPHGHLENEESARLMRKFCSDRTSTIILSHLSLENNRPDIALSTYTRIMGKKAPRILVAPRTGPSAVIESGMI